MVPGFNDPNLPKTCFEFNSQIALINQISTVDDSFDIATKHIDQIRKVEHTALFRKAAIFA